MVCCSVKIFAFISFVAFTMNFADGYVRIWDLPEEDKEAFQRETRVSGDLFQQLQAINDMIHESQQEGCKKHNEECSWSEKDDMQCCHRLTCRCTLLGGNCRCIAKMF